MTEDRQPFIEFDVSDLPVIRGAAPTRDIAPPAGVDVARLFGLVGDIYGTIAAPEAWRGVLDGVCGIVGAQHGMSGVFDVNRPEVHRHDASSGLSNSELLTILNTATTERFERFVELYSLPPRTLMHFPDPAKGPDQKIDGFVTMLRDRYGVRRMISANANPHHSWFDYVTLFFGEGPGEDPGRDARISFLLPHFAKANEARRPLELLRQKYRAVFSVLDRLDFGVILVDDSRAIIAANEAAEEILSAGDGLRRTADGRLAAAVAEEEAGLAARIAAAADNAHGEAAHVTRHFTAARRSGRRPYVLEANPFVERAAGELNMPLEGAMIFCFDPEGGAGLDVEGMRLAFSLTPAETEIGGLLLSGFTNDQIAERREVSLATVKTQAKALFAKTRTRNRADFIRLAASVSPPLKPAP